MVQYPFSDAPQPGELIEVAPRVKWLRMPLPFALNHINLWVLEDEDAVTLIDTGVDTAPTRDLWAGIFAGPLKGKKINRLICTHFHPDHMGLAGWFNREHGVAVHMTPGEIEAARLWHGERNPALLQKLTEYLVQGGVDPELAALAAGERRKIPSLVSTVPDNVTPLDPAKPIMAAGGEWRVIIGEGHAPQLITLYSQTHGALISSDQILPQISPNISLSLFTPEADPLRLFLDGFARFRDLPEDTLVLPSHRMPFRGLHKRIESLIAHHHHRLDVALKACPTPVTAMEVLAKLFPKVMDPHSTFFALGETLAHLNYLIARGQVARQAGPGRATLYHAVPEVA